MENNPDTLPTTGHGRITVGKTYKQEFIEIKGIGEYIKPVKAKRGSIGYDLAVPEDVVIPAHSRKVVRLNFAINLPFGCEAKIEPRSGMSSKGMEGYGTYYEYKRFLKFFKRKVKKYGLWRFNADVLVGKVDPLYTDSVGIIIKNDDEQFEIRKGTRIAQMTIYRVPPVRFIEVDELSCESRGGGFESSGTSSTENNEELPPTRLCN